MRSEESRINRGRLLRILCSSGLVGPSRLSVAGHRNRILRVAASHRGRGCF